MVTLDYCALYKYSYLLTYLLTYINEHTVYHLAHNATRVGAVLVFFLFLVFLP